MTDEQTGADRDHVIPPPPADSDGRAPSFPPVVPLAPPVSAPAPPPPPAAPLPPYAAAMPPAPDADGYPAAAPAPVYAAPAPAKSSNTLGIVLALVGGLVVLAVVGVAVLIGLLMPSRDEAAPAPAPSPSAFAEDPDEPSEDPPSDGDEPSDPETDATGIADRLEAKIEEYKRLRDSGALWQTIPDNEYNRTAVSAYLYLMTDMKVATIWGVDAAQAQEYDERMVMLEEKLLAQEPLGDDIKITLDDRIFTYDGETGEGGYTDK